MRMTFHGPVPITFVRDLPTPELALELLKSLARSSDICHNNMLRGAEQAFAGETDLQFLLDRLVDAWAWLESRALIGPHSRNSEPWRQLTAAGRALAADAAALTKLTADERLAGPLDPSLDRARTLFNLGDYETACFSAMKAVEVAVRSASGLDSSLLGVQLMRQAFKPAGGVLTDAGAHLGEQTAVMELFTGAIGAFKNPASHRTVTFEDPMEAAEIIQVADLLLRILRCAEQRKPTGTATSGTATAEV